MNSDNVIDERMILEGSGPVDGVSGLERAKALRDLKGSAAFKKALDEMWELHIRKANDYGDSSRSDPLANIRASEDFGIPGWLGALLRGNDKVHRLKEYARHRNLQNENARDSLIDLACYSVIALVLFDEECRERDIKLKKTIPPEIYAQIAHEAAT